MAALSLAVAEEEVHSRLPETLGSTATEHHRPQPWHRREEVVRPIFWAHRGHSYADRTRTWAHFPNGRWGDIRKPDFGELRDFHLVSTIPRSLMPNKAAYLAAWGEHPVHLSDIGAVFVRFLKGEVPCLPWMTGPLAQESSSILTALIEINEHGFWTVNSQPKVNSVPSSDPVHGWGPPVGRVWQKAYLEFFVSPEKWELLKSRFSMYPSLTYQAVNRSGLFESNSPSVNAVTWGAFPCKPVIQPTIVDPDAFKVWKDEAFSLWNHWKALYSSHGHTPGTGSTTVPSTGSTASESWQLIDRIQSSFFLVNIVDNDFLDSTDTLHVFLTGCNGVVGVDGNVSAPMASRDL